MMEEPRAIYKAHDGCNSCPVCDSLMCSFDGGEHVICPSCAAEIIKAVPQIKLIDRDSDNPKLTVNGVVVAKVMKTGNGRWGIHYCGCGEYKDKKQEATKAMCEKFGVGHLAKGV